jgi:hypothetical protein
MRAVKNIGFSTSHPSSLLTRPASSSSFFLSLSLSLSLSFSLSFFLSLFLSLSLLALMCLIEIPPMKPVYELVSGREGEEGREGNLLSIQPAAARNEAAATACWW